MRKLPAFLLAIAFLAAALFAAGQPLKLMQPTALVSDGDTIRYGQVGPGQTFVVQIDPMVQKPSGEFAGQWDFAYAANLPQGWMMRPSKLNQKPLQVEITPSPDAADGEYTFMVTVDDENNLDNIGTSQAFQVVVRINHDVLDMQVTPTAVEVGAGQPARIGITLTNTGSANDVFDISSKGVKGWAFHKSVYLAAGASKTITYEIAGFDESEYKVYITARSTASPLISKEEPVRMSVRSNLISDYKATSHGVLLFPILQSPLYALAGLIGALFP